MNFWPMFIVLWMFFVDMFSNFIVNSLEPTPSTSDFWSNAKVVMELP